MRVSEDRYARELRRLELAARMIRLGLRAHAVRQWTGLAKKRLEKLRADVLRQRVVGPVARHHGPPRTSVMIFFKPLARRDEGAALAALCRLYQVLPSGRGEVELKHLASVARGERLCQAYEAYLALVPSPRFALDEVLLLVSELTRGETVALQACEQCAALLLVDLGNPQPYLCWSCTPGPHRAGTLLEIEESPAPPEHSITDIQGQLF